MDDVYRFAEDAVDVKHVKSQERILGVMVKQTTDCAHFILSYAQQKDFCTSNYSEDVDPIVKSVSYSRDEDGGKPFLRNQRQNCHLYSEIRRTQSRFSRQGGSANRNHCISNS